jgi:hypothetical protein
LEILSERSHELEQGAVAIVEEARYRIRRLPILAREESPSVERSS